MALSATPGRIHSAPAPKKRPAQQHTSRIPGAINGQVGLGLASLASRNAARPRMARRVPLAVRWRLATPSSRRVLSFRAHLWFLFMSTFLICPPRMPVAERPRPNRKLAAIFAADIAGYSALVRADEERTVRKLNIVRDAILPIIEDFGGRWPETEYSRSLEARCERSKAPWPSKKIAWERSTRTLCRKCCFGLESPLAT